MSDRPTEMEYRRAKDAGAQARRNGRKVGECPYHGNAEKVRILGEAWRNGHNLADMARKARR